MDDKMHPDNSPNLGGKKANNLPLVIAAFIGVIVVSVIIYGGYQRFEDNKKKKDESKTHVEKPADAKVTIDNLLSNYDKSQKAKKVEAPKPQAEEKKVEHSEQRKAQTPEERLAEQIKQKKLQEIQAAIGAHTAINGGEWAKKTDTKKETSPTVTAKVDKDKWALNSEVDTPKSPYMLRAGHVFPSVMVSGINSSLPGKLIAQISENIYDTATHKNLLIPQGTKLFGEYASDIEFGQERLMVAWNRLTFPDGKTLDIGEMPGTDMAGYSGFKDQVNHHYLRIYGNALLMSAIVGATALSQNQGQGSNQAGFGQNSNSILSQSLGQTLGQATTRMLQKNMNIAPTIEISAGYEFNVMVTKDITFESEFQSFDY